MTPSRRTLALIVLMLAAATAWIGPASVAVAATDPTATISEVTCAAEDGTVTVDLLAGDSAAAVFAVLVDESEQGDDIPLAAGESAQVTVDALEDGDHTIEVLAGPDSDTWDTVASETRTVACDAAPVGPYTNVKGTVYDGCEATGVVEASNKAIGGNTEDLQPVTFEVAFTPTDDPPVGTGDGGDGTPVDVDPGPDQAPRRATVGVEQILDTFTLDAATQTYERTFDTTDLGLTGDLTLRTGDTVVAAGHIGTCAVLPVSAESGGSDGPAVPDTGF